MRILYLGLFERPYDTEVYIADTLESLGHTVDRMHINAVTAEILVPTFKRPYDFLLLSKGWFVEKDLMSSRALLKQCPFPTISWFFDLVWGTARERFMLQHPMFHTDLVLTTDGGHEAEFKAAGVQHKVLRQGIYEPEAYMGPEDESEKRDIVFIGTNVHETWFNWKIRGELLHWLRHTYGDRFRWLGQKDGIRNEKLNAVIANAKVVIGDSVYGEGYWSNRLYETLGRGGFLLFPMVPGIEKEFTPFKHFIPYRYQDYTALKEKIDYFLVHPEEREVVRRAGFEHCKANHTYTHRCKELIEIVKTHDFTRKAA